MRPTLPHMPARRHFLIQTQSTAGSSRVCPAHQYCVARSAAPGHAPCRAAPGQAGSRRNFHCTTAPSQATRAATNHPAAGCQLLKTDQQERLTSMETGQPDRVPSGFRTQDETRRTPCGSASQRRIDVLPGFSPAKREYSLAGHDWALKRIDCDTGDDERRAVFPKSMPSSASAIMMAVRSPPSSATRPLNRDRQQGGFENAFRRDLI